MSAAVQGIAVSAEIDSPEQGLSGSLGVSVHPERTHVALSASSNPLARAMADAARSLNEPAEDVEAVLARLADVALQTIPDVDMASISVATRTGINTTAATHEAARDLDRLQYQLQQGPCVDALLDPDKAEVVVADMAYDQRWPKYARAAAELGSGPRGASKSSTSVAVSEG